MKFSTKTEYGLKAMVCLAKTYPGRLSSRDLSETEHIPFKYLEQIMAVLKKENMVKSTKGKAGGYALAKNPSAYRVSQIIRSLDGPIMPMNCYNGKCALGAGCASSRVWQKLGKAMEETLDKIRLDQLI